MDLQTYNKPGEMAISPAPPADQAAVPAPADQPAVVEQVAGAPFSMATSEVGGSVTTIFVQPPKVAAAKPAPPPMPTPIQSVTTHGYESKTIVYEPAAVAADPRAIMPPPDQIGWRGEPATPPQTPPPQIAGWHAWLRLGGQWERCGGPYPTLDAATEALGVEVGSRGLLLDWRDQVVTSKNWPPNPQYAPLAGWAKTPIESAARGEYVIVHPTEPAAVLS